MVCRNLLKSILIGDSNIFNFFVPANLQSLLFFCKFYFVKFKPKILLLLIEADVMMLLIFVQCLCIVAPCSFAIQIRMAASTCFFQGPPSLPLPRFPKPRAITKCINFYQTLKLEIFQACTTI